jgi:hypothetical protein
MNKMGWDIERTDNYSSGKNFHTMKQGETYYTKKLVNNFDYTFFCKFVKFEKGIVYGEIVDMHPDYAKSSWIEEHDPIMKSRPTKCYLWGLREKNQRMSDHDFCCHWFNSNGICP